MNRVLARRPDAARALPDAAAMLANLPVPVVLLDSADRFRFANQAAEQFLGLSLQQLGSQRLQDLLPSDSPIFLLIGQARASDASIADHDMTLESPRLHKRGIMVLATPMPEEPGAVLLVLQDASAARTLDRQLSFRGAARSVSGMAAMLAHEVKNPLSGIRGAAQLLERSVAAADRELAVLIRDEADRIRALVDRIELFGERPIEREAVNIHRVLEHVRRLATTGFARSVRITEFYDPSLPPVWGNRDQLVQVLLNLVKNAAEAFGGQAAAGGSEIALGTGYHHGLWVAAPGASGPGASGPGASGRVHLPLVVTVRDNGPGIPDEVLAHLFEPFITSKPSGRGLGLALVAKIVGEHGGLIEVESRPGRTEFRIFLPVAAASEAE